MQDPLRQRNRQHSFKSLLITEQSRWQIKSWTLHLPCLMNSLITQSQFGCISAILRESLAYFAPTLAEISPGTRGTNSQLESVNQYLFHLQLLWWWPKLCLNRNRFPIRSHDLVENSENKMEFFRLFSGQRRTQRQTNAQTGNKHSKTTTSSTMRLIHLLRYALYKTKGCN